VNKLFFRIFVWPHNFHATLIIRQISILRTHQRLDIGLTLKILKKKERKKEKADERGNRRKRKAELKRRQKQDKTDRNQLPIYHQCLLDHSGTEFLFGPPGFPSASCFQTESLWWTTTGQQRSKQSFSLSSKLLRRCNHSAKEQTMNLQVRDFVKNIF
jgi:hypothetical protein